MMIINQCINIIYLCFVKIGSSHRKINFACPESTDVEKNIMPILNFGGYKKGKHKIEDSTPKYFKSVVCGPENAFFIDSLFFS